jgi:sterol desaturase/sphingolipid hydroxylase (fatty acid hydroxylase superfamily)
MFTVDVAELESARWIAFGGTLAAVTLVETWWPYRAWPGSRVARYATHFALIGIGQLALRILFPMSLVAWAVAVERSGFGVLRSFESAMIAQWIVTIVLLDLAVYWQHRSFHRVGWLWRFHQVHHLDPGFDSSTALRFHPVEITLSFVIKGLVVAVLGAPAAAVMAFEIILSSSALFTHANFSLGNAAEGWVRRIFVTPDMHRVHHSQRPREAHANFGFCFSFWDRAFGSYRDSSVDDPRTMPLGWPIASDARPLSVVWLLAWPLRRGRSR